MMNNNTKTAVNRYFRLITGLAGLVALIQILSYCNADAVADDAYMYIRYADNLISHGVFAWNPGDGPAYGLTSPLYLSVVLPLRMIWPNASALTAWMSSLVCGLVFVALLVRLLERYTPAARTLRRGIIMLVSANLALSVNLLGVHLQSGMDTAFAMAYLTAYLLIAKRYEELPGRGTVIVMGVFGGLAFSARPDLLLYTVIIPFFLLIRAPDKKSGKEARQILGLTLAVIAAQILLAFSYFRVPLPLPFYIKSLKYYGEHFYEVYRAKQFSARMFADYFHAYPFLFLLLGIRFLLFFRKRKSGDSPVNSGTLIATILFLSYYYFFVLQIVYVAARFYYPTLPALVFLGAQTVAGMVRSIPLGLKRELKPFTKHMWTALFILLLPFLTVKLGRFSRYFREVRSYGMLGDFKVRNAYRRNYTFYWLCLEEFSDLPDDLIIATTEIGLPSVLNPRKKIIDISGLNNTVLAREGLSADRLFQEARPDLIYMPIKHYKAFRQSLMNHPVFQIKYEYFPSATLGRWGMGIALYKEGRYYSQMREIIEEELKRCLPRPTNILLNEL